MKASTQYNDYKGTAAADVSDYLFIRDYLKDRGVDIERYEPVGFELYTGYSNFVSYRFICKDNYSDENRLVKIGFESKDNISDFWICLRDSMLYLLGISLILIMQTGK